MNRLKKINILYIGDALSKHGSTPTSIETLAPLLNEFYHMHTASDKKNKLLRLFDMLSSVITKRNILDFIIIDTYSTKNFYYALLVSQLARLLNIKYITCLRGGDLPGRLKRTPFLTKLIFENSFINVAPSKYLQDIFLNSGYNVKYIPNNIQLDLYGYKERKSISPSLLYVRAFQHIYNPQMAINAFNELKKKYTSAVMCMVGPDKDGTLEECQLLVEKLNLSKSITFAGKLTKLEWRELSKNYDIFINPTNFDNQPVSVIEAMALGFPIISTNVGGIPFLIDDKKNGLLIKKNDTEMMTKKIIELLQTPGLSEKLSNNARLKAESFDWKRIQKLWKEILD